MYVCKIRSQVESVFKQGCALTTPGRLKQLTFSFGGLNKITGRQAGHSCL